jgi:hypothetical protein
LLSAIDAALRPLRGAVKLRIPHGAGTALALCYERGRVLSRSDGPSHVEVEVELPPRLLGAVAPYRV